MADSEEPVDFSRLPKPRYQPCVIVLSAAVAGILADRLWPLPLAAWCILAVVGLVLWAALELGRQLHCRPFCEQPGDGSTSAAPMANRAESRRQPWHCLFQAVAHGREKGGLVVGNVLVLVAVAATAGAWRHCCWSLFPADDLGRYTSEQSEPVCVEAIAVESPRALTPRPFNPMRGRPAKDGSRLTVDLVSLRTGATWQPASGRAMLLVTGEPPNVEAGDRIRCFGQLAAPEGPQNPGQFDYAARLRTDRILSRLHTEAAECVTVVRSGSEWNLWRQLGRLRSHCNQTLTRYVNQRRAELAAAVLLGFREELDADRNEAFLTTGTVHVLSISGLHVGVLAAALFWIMRRTQMRRGLAAAAVAIITLLYTLMVDAEPPVVRATVLVLIAAVAVWLGSQPLGFNSLAAAALAVLAVNPAYLFHTGAQLSFLCVAGLIWFANRRPHADGNRTEPEKTLERLISQNLSRPSHIWRQLKRSVIGIAQAGIVVWILTTPLVLARFHILSVTALGLNVLLWPLMSLSLLSGFGVLLFGSFCSPLAHLCGWLCDGSFWLLEGGVNLGHRIPYGHFWLPGPADWWLWGFYGALAAVVAFPRIRPPTRWCIALLAAWIALGFAASMCRHDRTRLDCTFLSVGHGSAVFIEFPSGKTMLYDAGHTGEPSSAARTIADALWDRGVARLDAVVFSHPDTDHYNALPELLDKLSVGAVYVSPMMFQKRGRAVAELRAALAKHKVPVREVFVGERVRADGDCRVEVLYPPRHGIAGSENANSLVLAVEYCGRRIVLPGDLETPGLNDMLIDEPQPCEVLMAPHHGSRQNNPPTLAAWCRPRRVVFSDDGRRNPRAVIATYRAIGSETLHTCTCGAIRVEIGKDGVKVTPFVSQTEFSTTDERAAR